MGGWDSPEPKSTTWWWDILDVDQRLGLDADRVWRCTITPCRQHVFPSRTSPPVSNAMTSLGFSFDHCHGDV